MIANNLPKFAAMMNALGELYGKEITETFSEIYWNTLKRFEWPKVKKAVSQHISDPDKGSFMPKPADIVRWIEGTQEMRALKAWVKVTEAIRQVGIYESVAFEDPIIHSSIVALGGWIKLCVSKTDNLTFIAKDFQKHYIEFLNDPPNKSHAHLLGIFRSSKPIQIKHDQSVIEKIAQKLEKVELEKLCGPIKKRLDRVTA